MRLLALLLSTGLIGIHDASVCCAIVSEDHVMLTGLIVHAVENGRLLAHQPRAEPHHLPLL